MSEEIDNKLDHSQQNASSQSEPSSDLDLSILSSLNFGPRWSKPSSHSESHQPKDRSPRSNDRPFRSHDRNRPHHPRRNFSPSNSPSTSTESSSSSESPSHDSSPRRDYSHNRSDNRSDRRPRDGRQHPSRPHSKERTRTYHHYSVNFYPEDDSFNVLVKAMKASCKTYQLFEIARIILEKPDRFVALLKGEKNPDGSISKIFVSLPDGLPFDSEQHAITHILKNCLDHFFSIEEIEVEAPKGTFLIVNKCGFTGELLAPPNYHRYQDIIRQHHATNFPNMSFDKFVSNIQGVRDEATVKSWLEKMTKTKRYTLKNSPEGQDPQVFTTWESVRSYLLFQKKSDLVKEVDQLRISGKNIPNITTQIFKNLITTKLAEQQHFPLQSANNLRGRFRRLEFTIYKRSGVSCICAVKRKFREKDTLSEELDKLVSFICIHKDCTVLNLPLKYLGVSEQENAQVNGTPVVNQSPVESTEPTDSTSQSTDSTESTQDQPSEPTQSQPTESPVETLTPDQKAALRQLMLDLRWLVSEGYVIEFGDGKLYAPDYVSNAQAANQAAAASEESHDSDSHEKTQSAQSEPTTDSQPHNQQPQEETSNTSSSEQPSEEQPTSQEV